MNMFKSSSEEQIDWADESLIESCGKLLLRITIGGLMVFHGVAKVQGGIDPIKGMLEAQGMPTLVAYGVYVGELVAPILMIIGLWTRLSSLVFVFNMIFA
ncbi:MAG: DoxX family protein, partial [Planctomycetota bacterium]